MTSPFMAYSTFMALRAHFTSKYDYVKYGGVLKSISQSSYEKRKDKYFFERLAKHKEVRDFLVANLIKNPKAWVTALAKPEAEEVFTEWKRKMQSLSYIVRTELKKIGEDRNLAKLLRCKEGTPLLLQAYLDHEISLETFCIILDLTEVKKFWDKKSAAPEWKEISPQVEKYTPFISYDKEKMKEIVFARFDDANFFFDID